MAHQDHFTEIVPYHEVAHQWWGNLVTWHSYRDQWICEGLANYISLLFADSRKDSDHALNSGSRVIVTAFFPNFPAKISMSIRRDRSRWAIG